MVAGIVSSFTLNIVSLVSSITWRLARRKMESTRVHKSYSEQLNEPDSARKPQMVKKPDACGIVFIINL